MREVLLSFEPEAVILGGGDYPRHEIPLRFLHECKCIVCCDGASNQCSDKGIVPWRIIGDGDSISPEVRAKYGDIIEVIPEQETNDQTKAVTYLSNRGIKHIVIVGGTGRREDHTIGNISLLLEYFHSGLDVRMYTDYGMFVACRDNTRFVCPKNTAVSIFSAGATDMHSEGLAYQLYDLNRLWQGTLNHTIAEEFTITCNGEYIVFLNYENKKIRE